MGSEEKMTKACSNPKSLTDPKLKQLCTLGNPTGKFNGKPTTLVILESTDKNGEYVYSKSMRQQAQTEWTQSLICKESLFDDPRIQTVFNSFATKGSPLPFNKESCG